MVTTGLPGKSKFPYIDKRLQQNHLFERAQWADIFFPSNPQKKVHYEFLTSLGQRPGENNILKQYTL